MTDSVASKTGEGVGLPPPDRGVRLEWADMPRSVRSEIEQWLGGVVVGAATQPTGFSPGVAARLTVDDGRRVFVKAVGPEPNSESPKIHRREIRIVADLPRAAPVPRLLRSYDEGEGGWVALVFEDVDGRHPMQPWRIDELDRVVTAMEELSMTLTPSPLPATVVGMASDEFVRGWSRLHEEQPSLLCRVDEWSRRHLEALVAIEDTVGDALVRRHSTQLRHPRRQHPAHARACVVRRLAPRDSRPFMAGRRRLCPQCDNAGRSASGGGDIQALRVWYC